MHHAFRIKPEAPDKATPRAVLVSRLAAVRAYVPEHPEEVVAFANAERRLCDALGIVCTAPTPPAPVQPAKAAPAPREPVRRNPPGRRGRMPGDGQKPITVCWRTWPSLDALAADIGRHRSAIYQWRNAGTLEERVGFWLAHGFLPRIALRKATGEPAAKPQPVSITWRGFTYTSLYALADVKGLPRGTVNRWWREGGEARVIQRLRERFGD